MQDMIALIHEKIPKIQETEQFAVERLLRVLDSTEFATANWTMLGFKEGTYPFEWAVLVDLESPQIAFRVRTVGNPQTTHHPSMVDICFLEDGAPVSEWCELPLHSANMTSIATMDAFRRAYPASLGFNPELVSSVETSTSVDD